MFKYPVWPMWLVFSLQLVKFQTWNQQKIILTHQVLRSKIFPVQVLYVYSKNLPIRTPYPINAIFWFNDFGVWVKNCKACLLKKLMCRDVQYVVQLIRHYFPRLADKLELVLTDKHNSQPSVAQTQSINQIVSQVLSVFRDSDYPFGIFFQLILR